MAERGGADGRDDVGDQAMTEGGKLNELARFIGEAHAEVFGGGLCSGRGGRGHIERDVARDGHGDILRAMSLDEARGGDVCGVEPSGIGLCGVSFAARQSSALSDREGSDGHGGYVPRGDA